MMAAMTARYVIRPDRDGHAIFDLWTGRPAVLAGSDQTGLSLADAEHTAELLNRVADAAASTPPAPALERGDDLHR